MLKSLSGGGGGGGGGSPGGSAGSVQYNSGSGFGGVADFTYTDSTETMTIGGNTSTPGYAIVDVDGVRAKFGTDGAVAYLSSNVGQVSFRSGTTERARFFLNASPYLEMIDSNGHAATFGSDSNIGMLFLNCVQNAPKFQFQLGGTELYTLEERTGAAGSGVVTAAASNAPANIAPVDYIHVTVGGADRYIILYG